MNWRLVALNASINLSVLDNFIVDFLDVALSLYGYDNSILIVSYNK